ncbi:hypothetical protein F383_14799 [Gossypium arboreum]|uniref:Uncharacterized protein n=1 Tax=Gossypium arboreum TaxID=29729 RepID=A0A0B0NCE8_GOSAR|nr:hypothetical protein F383_14799 [Gossypium arboreum]
MVNYNFWIRVLSG